MNKLLICALIIFILFLGSPLTSQAAADAVVYAVLFYSPSCGHCHLVITETLPPLFEKYGDQLVIVGVDVSTAGGQQLFSAALQYFGVESGGVPFLVVGEHYLIGSADIPNQFPGMIEDYLAQGGVGWPAIPGLMEALAASSTEQAAPTGTSAEGASAASTPAAAATTTASDAAGAPEPTPTPGLIVTGEESADSGPKFSRDPVGNTLSVIVLAAMVVSFVAAAISFFRPAPKGGKTNPQTASTWRWLFPVLSLIGLGVASYLAFVETAQVEAVCGPVGDCNAVQQSQYAKLFGIFPIGVIGVVGYVLIFLSWVLGRTGSRPWSDFASLAILGMTTFGILFSIYLTFLEPFVIGATCAWCLSSAVIMTALFWLSLAPGRLSLVKLKK